MAYADAFDAKYPGLLDAIVGAESNNNPNSVSPKGAIGLFQFMPATASDLGIDPTDPVQSRNGAARYMDTLIKQTGAVPNALAAWNWGIGHVQRLGLGRAPDETRNFVSKVMGNWNGGQQAAQPQGDDITGQMRQAINHPDTGDSGGFIGTAYADTMPHPQDDPVMADMQAAMGNAGKTQQSDNAPPSTASGAPYLSINVSGGTVKAEDPAAVKAETESLEAATKARVDAYYADPKNQKADPEGYKAYLEMYGAPDPVMQDMHNALSGKPPAQQPDQSSYMDALKYGFSSDDFKKSLHPKGGLLGNALQGVGMVPEAAGAMIGGLAGAGAGAFAIPGVGAIPGEVVGMGLGGTVGHNVSNLIGEALGVRQPMALFPQSPNLSNLITGEQPRPDMLTDTGHALADNFAGAFAGPVIDKGLGFAWKGIKSAAGAAKDAVTGGNIEEKAGQILRDSNTSGTQNVIDAINNQQGTIVGHNPTLGQVTDDSALKSLERSVFSRGDAKTQGMYADRLQANKQAVNDAIQSVTPTTEAQATRDFLTQQHANTTNYFDRQLNGQQSTLDQKLAQATSGMDQTSASEAARAQIEANLEAARGQERQLWQAIDPTGNTTADMTAINQKAQDILGTVKKATNPNSVPDIVKEIAGTNGQPLFSGTESLDELTALRSRVAADLRAEEKALAPDRNKIRMLTDLNNTITDTMNGVGNRLSDPAVAARWQQANQFSAQLNDAYTKGLTGKMVYGDRVADSSTLSRYLGQGNGSKENAQAFIKAMGGVQQAEPLARDYLLRDALDKNVSPDGTVNIKNLGQWLKNNKDVLDQFPNVRNELSNVLKASQTLKNTGELKARALDDFQNSTAGLYLNNDPAHVINNLLTRSGDPVTDARQLMNQVRMNRDATAGVQRAVFDHMMGQVQSAMTEETGGAKFMNYLKKNNGALKTMLTPQQYDMLQNVGEAVRMNSRVANFNPVAGSQTVSNASALPQEKGFKGKVFGMLLDKIKGLGGAAGGVLGGPMGAVGGVAADSAINAIRNMSNEKVMGLLRDAFMDPKLAAKLMQPVNNVTAPAISKTLRPYIVQSVVQPTFQQSPPHKVWHDMWQPSPSYQ